ncbi:MAG TPA: transposase, partial [Firmicutes bacterium]|nr:transposase [Bacillota bacterium]
MLSVKKPGTGKAKHIISRDKEKEVLRACKKLGSMATNYIVGCSAGVSASTAGRIINKYRPKQKNNPAKQPEIKVKWGKLHTCWSIDTLTVKLAGGIKAYLQLILEERSRCILSSQLIMKKSGKKSAGLIRATIHAFNLAPLVLKHDRGSEFMNSDVQGLLKNYRILPLVSPYRYPPYNGKLENTNRLIRKYMSRTRPMSYEKTEALVKEAVCYINEEMPRAIFEGRTSKEIYSAGIYFKESCRRRFTWLVKKHMDKFMKNKKRKMSRATAYRKA